MNWITSQIGAREHYAVPRVLHRARKLEVLYTDFWATAPWRLLGKMAGKSSLATRCHPELAGAPVTAFNLQALKASRQRFSNPYEGFLAVGRQFGEQVVNDLESRVEGRESRAGYQQADQKALDPRPSSLVSGLIFFSYDTGFLEPAQWVKAHGGKSIICQMDPSRFEVDLVKAEERKWPGWAKRSAEVPEAYFKRREAEWAAADLVMVNSEWSKQALMKQGVSDDKIVVVPLAFEATKAPAVEGRGTRVESLDSSFRFDATLPPQSSGAHSGLPSAVFRAHSHGLGSSFTKEKPLRVLFLGQVILRKGIQYLIEAAKLLKDEPIHFDVVGSIGISDDAVASAPSNMTFHGPVSRDRTEEFYRSADLFVLPTLSDGFALTQLEAMAHGLPVIATPNCGEVVSDGVDGLIVQASDSNALAEAFQLVIQDPDKLQAMSAATEAKLEQFSLAKLEGNLAELENRLLAVH
jgi:glycosyltransferase involved in cell wall biosynthesis